MDSKQLFVVFLLSAVMVLVVAGAGEQPQFAFKASPRSRRSALYGGYGYGGLGYGGLTYGGLGYGSYAGLGYGGYYPGYGYGYGGYGLGYGGYGLGYGGYLW